MSELPPPRPTDPTLVDQPLPLPASERTLIDPPLEALSVEARSRTMANHQTSDRLMVVPTATPIIPDVGIEKRLNPQVAHESRYAIGALLGTGSSSHVYAGHDRTFDREVAIKFLETGLAEDDRRLSRFVGEARMTARLDHPNIVPVYDLNSTPAGDLYLTMRQVKGLSLGDAMRRAADGDLPSELGGVNQRVNILLKVCDALACAHDRGIAHLDVKPDNIMLGTFGEVVLVDWGLARRFDEAPRVRQHISGTPAYMSPEQCAGHPGDALADIYCLGATLFHVLTLRHPTWGSDEAEFWAKKRSGTIDPPTAEERARIPRQLLAIALKALAKDRQGRYASVKALSEDLQHYQAGLAVSAYRESRLERAARWHRLHARPLWLGVAATVMVITSAWYVYGERLKEVVAWGAPSYRQDFSDDGWRADFTDVGNVTRWERQEERIVSAGNRSNFLFLSRRFYGPVAVEMEGEMQPGHPPCDLSLAWSPTDPATDPDWKRGAYLLQTGAYDNTFVAISNGVSKAYARTQMRLTPGKRYRLRFEIDGDFLAIDLDGKRICEYQPSFPCTSGFIGLYAFYPGKAFDDFTVYVKEVPERQLPTATGDAFYQRDLPLEAAEQYRLVAESFAGTKLGDQARYKHGLCLAKLDRKEEALAMWDSLHDRGLVSQAQCIRIEWSNNAGDVPGAVARFLVLYRDDPALRPRLHLLFASAIQTILAGPPTTKRSASIGKWLALTGKPLPADPTVDAAAAQALASEGQWEAVVNRYPHIEASAATALLALGRPAEALSRYPDVLSIRGDALFDLARFDEVLREFPKSDHEFYALHFQGRHEEALATAPWEDQRIQSLIWTGRVAEALAMTKVGSVHWYSAMIHLGRVEEALAAESADPPQRSRLLMLSRRYDEIIEPAQRLGLEPDRQALLGRWLTAIEKRDPAGADAALAAAKASKVPMNRYNQWFMRLVAVEFVSANGDPAVFMAAMRALAGRGPGCLSQRPWHAARYLLGEIDEAAYLAQPAADHAPAALLVMRAMRAELAGDRENAAADYRAYLARPLRLRAWDSRDGDSIVDHFITWRLAEIAP